MIIEHHKVVCGVNRDSPNSPNAFVRVVRLRDRRIIAVANGHTFMFDTGVPSITRPVLDSVERRLAQDPTASVESLFDTGRAAFLLATEDIPEDVEDIGGPCAQLTIVDISPGRLRAGLLGRFQVIVLRDDEVQQDSTTCPWGLIERAPKAPSLMECTLLERDLVIVSTDGARESGTVLEDLALILEPMERAHREPRALVEAALSSWRDEVRRQHEAGTRVGEPLLVFAAVRV